MLISKIPKAILSEFIGTGLITLSYLYTRDQYASDLDYKPIDLSIIVFLVSFITMNIFLYHSGSQFNPIITFTLMISKRLSKYTSILYIIMQFLGSVSAFVIYKALILIFEVKRKKQED